MLNVEELEQQWLRYKIKSYIPHGVIVISSLSIIVVLLFFFNSDINTTPHNIEQNSLKEDVSQREQKTIQNTTPPTKVTTPVHLHVEESKKMVLTPSIDFIKEYKEVKKPPQIKHEEEEQKKPSQVINKPLVKVEETPKTTAIEPKETITIQRKDSQEDLDIIIRRFQKTNNPELSLFIAKKYYSMKEYKEAYNYALITNKINNNIEGSWLVFSKALVKLGKKKIALKVLNQYIDYSGSNKAEILRDEITSGKFR